MWASLFHFHWVISRNSVCRNVQGVGDSMTLILLFILDTITQNNKGFALNKNCHLFSPPRPCQGLSFHPPTWHMSPGATWERQAQCRVILLKAQWLALGRADIYKCASPRPLPWAFLRCCVALAPRSHTSWQICFIKGWVGVAMGQQDELLLFFEAPLNSLITEVRPELSL